MKVSASDSRSVTVLEATQGPPQCTRVGIKIYMKNVTFSWTSYIEKRGNKSSILGLRKSLVEWVLILINRLVLLTPEWGLGVVGGRNTEPGELK